MLEISLIIFSYVMGSIPFGLILAHLWGAGDLRKIGSGNIGATNALRAGGKLLGGLTFLLDFLKGYLPVWLAANYEYSHKIQCIVAAMAVLGHVYPVWLKFKGGKGVATTLGVVMAIAPLAGLILFVSWLLIFAITRTSAIASLVAMLITTIFVWFFYCHFILGLMLFLSVLVLVRHKENLARIFAGKENKI
jgi:glycerol-3-phosphate acyltransferase PlsY